METKACSSCLSVKPLNRFYKSHATPDGRDYYCKECRNDRVLGWRATNRDKWKEYTREYAKRTNYQAQRAYQRRHRKRLPEEALGTSTSPQQANQAAR